MCIKVGNNELSSVKALMTMSLNAIIADTFDLELEDIKRDLRLSEDLHMDATLQSQLSELVAEYFDGLQLDYSQVKTVDDLFDVIVEQEFSHIPAEAF